MHENVCYKRNFLTEVIARVDFASPIVELERRLHPQVRDAVMKSFPIPEPKEVVAQQIQASKQAVRASRSTFTEWNFHGKDRDKTLTIAPNTIFVVYRAYESYEVLQREFLDFTSAFFKAYADTQGNRLGLRYVNNITIDQGELLDWSSYINPQMLGFLEFYTQAAMVRALGLLEFSFDDLSARFQFGLHNPDHPAPIRRKVYVLDFDAYYAGPLEENEIAPNLDKFHSRIQELFERSITDKLREIMNA